jgi:hypothetical protein
MASSGLVLENNIVEMMIEKRFNEQWKTPAGTNN